MQERVSARTSGKIVRSGQHVRGLGIKKRRVSAQVKHSFRQNNICKGVPRQRRFHSRSVGPQSGMWRHTGSQPDRHLLLARSTPHRRNGQGDEVTGSSGNS